MQYRYKVVMYHLRVLAKAMAKGKGKARAKGKGKGKGQKRIIDMTNSFSCLHAQAILPQSAPPSSQIQLLDVLTLEC